MKHFISFLLELPVCVVLNFGVGAIIGLNNWWCIPITVILLLSFIKGYEMTRGV
jgi:hypothetical protein